MDPDVPLIVPEVNAAAAAGFTRKYIIANPNCSTAQLVVALKPLHDAAKILRVVVSTYQSVSGAGKEAMDELFSQTRAVFTSGAVESKKFPKRMAFNVIPQIDVFMEDGFTKEEWKMAAETKKILDPKIKLVATCVRVPVFIGHSEAVNIEFERPISPEEATEILRSAPGVLVIDKREPGGYITPHEAAGEDATYISRIRADHTVDNGIVLWCVADNLRKGAALNAVQIAEVLMNRKLLGRRRGPPETCAFMRARACFYALTAAFCASCRVASSTLWNSRSWPSVAKTPNFSRASSAREELEPRDGEIDAVLAALGDDAVEDARGGEVDLDNAARLQHDKL